MKDNGTPPSLKLVAGEPDQNRAALHRHCRRLIDGYQLLANGAEKCFKPGMLVQWKAGMRNKQSPEYGEPQVVIEFLETPQFDPKTKSGSPYFREPLDLFLGHFDEDGDFIVLSFDSRRFEPLRSFEGGAEEAH